MPVKEEHKKRIALEARPLLSQEVRPSLCVPGDIGGNYMEERECRVLGPAPHLTAVGLVPFSSMEGNGRIFSLPNACIISFAFITIQSPVFLSLFLLFVFVLFFTFQSKKAMFTP